MARFNNLSIGVRLGATFAALAVAVVVVSTLSLRSLGASDERFTDFFEGINARASTVSKLRMAVDARAVAARNMALATDPADLAREKGAAAQAHAEVRKQMEALKELAGRPGVSGKARELIAAIDKVEAAYGPVALHIVEAAAAGNRQQAVLEINEKCRPLLEALEKAADEYARFTEATSRRIADESHADYKDDRTLMVAASLAAVLFAMLAGWLVTRSITQPIARAVGIAETVAAGDLSSEIVADTQDETGKLLRALAAMNANLRKLVSEVRQSSDGIAVGSGQIATGNTDLSQRTEEQASSLEQTAASMRQLTATVRETEQNAHQASDLSLQARGAAEAGGQAVEQVVQTMSEISQASHKIADIIGVIDGIAFQTNILALNAAVEAARAGEQGRGFAVVAAEVRSLAQRSAGAAKEIKQLITDSVVKVEEGSALVDQAGRTMSEIMGSVKRVTDIMADISAASQEQSSGIEQVNQAITQMDEGTQQNAALVEEASASAESMRQQATLLVEAVSAFRTAAAQAATQAKAPARAPAKAPAMERASAPTAPIAAPAGRPKAPVARKAPSEGVAPAGGARSRGASGSASTGGDQHWQEF